jgi:hypothetical protein
MKHASRIVLHSPPADPSRLEAFVEACIADGVELIAISGPGAAKLEDEIDWIIIGDGSNFDRFIVTSIHDSIEEARNFAENWNAGQAATAEEIVL